MTYNLVLYCKSYRNDVIRAKTLLASIVKYNKDNIPFFISVPSNDIQLFKDTLGTENYILIEDETIDLDYSGWIGQQIIKTQFWKTGLCDNYVCVDSDCIFIKDFYITDFMFDKKTPYTVCHEYKSFFEFLDKHATFPFDPYESFVHDRLSIMKLFDRTGVVYDFGPGPNIWSTKVWKSLSDKYIIPNNLTFSKLLRENASEVTWYGEWLLYDETIRLVPRGPLFKNYHYPVQLEYDKLYNYDINKISKHYLGIGMQSIYNLEL